MTFADINVTQTGIHEFKINAKKKERRMRRKCHINVLLSQPTIHFIFIRFDIRRDIALVM